MNLAKKYMISFTPAAVRAVSVVLIIFALLIDSLIPTVVKAESVNPAEVFAPRVLFPNALDRDPLKTVQVVATAYNSLPGQTDSTPFITASGTRTRHGVVAANFLKIGTRVRFPEVYGNTIFVVEDRMNARYGWGRVDIWMEHYSDAKIFGAQRMVMEIF